MSWADSRFIALDFEATSPDPEVARPVSACIAWVGGGEATELRRWLINPGVPIPAESTAIHGITDEQVQAEGIPASAAVEGVLGELELARADQMPLVIMNARYDLTLLDREARRQTGEGVPAGLLRPVFDPMVVDRKLDRYRKGKRTLTDLCATYKVNLDDAHAADSDALAAARLAWRMAMVYPEIRCDLDTLHDKQTAWAAEQATGLADYFRRLAAKQSDLAERDALLVKADGVSGEWPLRRFVESKAAVA